MFDKSLVSNLLSVSYPEVSSGGGDKFALIVMLQELITKSEGVKSLSCLLWCRK